MFGVSANRKILGLYVRKGLVHSGVYFLGVNLFTNCVRPYYPFLVRDFV